MATTAKPYQLRNPQAAAWLILLIAFGLFCAGCLATSAVVWWFLFDSQIEMSTTLSVGKGRVDGRLPDGTSLIFSRAESVQSGTTLAADATAQGYITFADNYSQQPVARLFLMQESEISLNYGMRPRFEFSRGSYDVRFSKAVGRFYLEVFDGLERGLSLRVQTTAGEMLFAGPGMFRLEVRGDKTTLYAERGTASLYALSGGTQPVWTGQRVVAQGSDGTAQVFAAESVVEDVLNADFGGREDIAQNPLLPVGWACTSQANRQIEPQGKVVRTLYQDAVVLDLRREGDGLDHAESRCIYTFSLLPGVPRDVSDYISLTLRARIKIQHQDVTTCGILGSECPIMLELEYLAAGNTPDQPQFWRHGFYAIRPAADTNPLACDTCLQEHEKLIPDSWYIYDSGDLFRLLPANKRPVKIIRMKVYASGHAYGALVSDLALIARKGQ